MDEQDAGTITLRPIGTVRSPLVWPGDAPRQGVLEGHEARIELAAGAGYGRGLEGLAGFERLWVLYVFHRHRTWSPLVSPPGRTGARVGVFATRAPRRPNPLGLACIRLLGVDGLVLRIADCDMLDGTPVLDLKPYLPYADAFPAAAVGWPDEEPRDPWTVLVDPAAEARLAWLAGHGFPALPAFVRRELGSAPASAARKRVVRRPDGVGWTLAYRTWRIAFQLDEVGRTVRVQGVGSGYPAAELAPGAPDPYADKGCHREFLALFPDPGSSNSG